MLPNRSLVVCCDQEEILKKWVDAINSHIQYERKTEHLKKIATLTPDVRSLNLNGCATINDASMGQLHLLRQLQTLDVEGCSITDRGVLALRKANGRITSLNLSGMSLSDSALELLVHGCNKLVCLQVRGGKRSPGTRASGHAGKRAIGQADKRPNQGKRPTRQPDTTHDQPVD